MQSMSVPIPQLFDMRALRWNRQRAAASFDKFAFLKDEAALRLVDRVDLMRRDFDLCLDVGAHDGRLSQHLAPLGKIRTIVHSDPAAKFSNNFFQRIKTIWRRRLRFMTLPAYHLRIKVSMRYFPALIFTG